MNLVGPGQSLVSSGQKLMLPCLWSKVGQLSQKWESPGQKFVIPGQKLVSPGK